MSDIDVLLVDCFQDNSVMWNLCWHCGMVVRNHGELSGWDGEDFLRGVLSVENGGDFDADTEG